MISAPALSFLTALSSSRIPPPTITGISTYSLTTAINFDGTDLSAPLPASR
jgi:hypothetical protein